MCFYNISQELCEMHPRQVQLRAGGITMRGSDSKREVTESRPHTPLPTGSTLPVSKEASLYTPAASVSLSVVLRMSARSQDIFPTAWPRQPPGLIYKGACFAIPGFADAVICPPSSTGCPIA